MKTVRLIALDMDRTLLNSEGRLSQRNRTALEKAAGMGISVVIASGRPYSALPEEVVSLPGVEYAITGNGCAIYRLSTGERISSSVLRSRAVFDVLAATENEKVFYECFIDGTAYIEGEYFRNTQSYGGSEGLCAYLHRTRLPVENMRYFIEKNADILDALDVITYENGDFERITAELSENVGDIYITSSAYNLIEISAADCGKGSGLVRLSEYLNIALEETTAFGDADNDIDMLRAAGTGIAVGNASPACLAAADAVTLTNDCDGVAEALENLFGIR